ncbi:Survival motor neuron interacting protein 1 [Heracleum sosnowskyi]|uniref:Survival motor neuron interacting protein 1 n=1 Tax=Heracleum sosnowskyi TaxID=360622 RepID=A0AAD8J687_9APIA|nr:Survival motor neuron interacting protein 1 [Heracleum sosnowskyi]
MNRSLGPVLRRELENLEKDSDSRKSAMKALKYYVKEMDSKAIPLFLAKVSESKETGSSGEYTISLYEVLARVHGPKIVPQIDNIMNTVVKTLSSSAGSFALQQACSKVVPAIARYGIDPTTPEDKKKHIIHSLAKPLSDSLLANQENLSSGSALCLKALVDSDNWRFASNEMVNEVCQRVAGALDRPMQTNSHIGLVMALAKNNSQMVEPYARLLIQSGLRILNVGIAEGNSRKRLSAIQMVNFLMKWLDPTSIFSELGLIMEELEKCQSDRKVFVKGAAFEALQTAKYVAAEEEKKYEREISSNSGSNFCRSKSPRRNLWEFQDQSSLSTSPESQTVDSSVGCNSFMESPFSSSYAYGDLKFEQRSANRKQWRSFENGVLDVSLNNGIFSELTPRSVIDDFEDEAHDESSGNKEEYANEFVGSRRNARSATPSPQRARSHINVNDVKIFTTPRKLICSLQDHMSENSEVSEKQSRTFKSPCASEFESKPASKYSQNGFSCHPASNYDHIFLPNMNHDAKYSKDDMDVYGSSESVSSSEYVAIGDGKASKKLVPTKKFVSLKINAQKEFSWPLLGMVGALFVILLLVFVSLWIGANHNEAYNLPPT